MRHAAGAALNKHSFRMKGYGIGTIGYWHSLPLWYSVCQPSASTHCLQLHSCIKLTKFQSSPPTNTRWVGRLLKFQNAHQQIHFIHIHRISSIGAFHHLLLVPSDDLSDRFTNTAVASLQVLSSEFYQFYLRLHCILRCIDLRKIALHGSTSGWIDALHYLSSFFIDENDIDGYC